MRQSSARVPDIIRQAVGHRMPIGEGYYVIDVDALNARIAQLWVLVQQLETQILHPENNRPREGTNA